MIAGMCLLDTTDGALMSALYTSPSFAQDNIAILYYSIVLTIITIIVAVVIGTIQLLSLILNVAEPTGHFWEGVEKVGDMYDVIGGCIAGLFVVVGVASVFAYKPWRRRVDMGMLRVGGDEGCGDEGCGDDVEQDVGRTVGDNKGTLREDVIEVPNERMGERSG
jgi:high-affinity nickel-transport protein